MFVPKPKYNRFRSPRDGWDDEDEIPRRPIMEAISIACAPVLLGFGLDWVAERRRRQDALENPELYELEEEE